MSAQRQASPPLRRSEGILDTRPLSRLVYRVRNGTVCRHSTRASPKTRVTQSPRWGTNKKRPLGARVTWHPRQLRTKDEYETENETEPEDKNMVRVTRWKRVTCVKKRWRATAGKEKRAVLVKAVRMRQVEIPIRVRSPEEEPQVVAAGKYENRGYMSVSIGRGVYYAGDDLRTTWSQATCVYTPSTGSGVKSWVLYP